MRTAVICFSDAGALLAKKVCEVLSLPCADVHSIEKFASKYGFTSHAKIAADMGDLFCAHDALIFIGACGIAVRDIAPHLKSKLTDPAVLVADEQGRHIVSLLSGHVGGGNMLTVRVADCLGGEPIVTTATSASSSM